jgi:hypothetical protein
MKKIYLVAITLFYFLLSNSVKAQSTGYIVLNEYMPWATNTCATNSEFVELYNFGPGPVNIGCYIVTDGDFTVTIPANTVINPGQYYVISGMDSIPLGCANINYVTHVDLNFNTCNCTSAAIPLTGDGWLTDGGSANEPVVLLDPNLKVVDAVVRKQPEETSSALVSSTIGGTCISQNFDLDTMPIAYETIGQSAGRGNSFARVIDGDCLWVKDPQQSGGTINNTGTATGSLTAVLSVTNVNSCGNNGSVSVSFTGVTDYSAIFPVNYILALDADSNNVFDLNDTYVNGIDSTSPTVDISGLAPGRYNLALEPASGCNYQFFQFTILPCNSTILEPNTFYFSAKKENKYVELLWTSEKMERIQRFEIEKSTDGINFKKIQYFQIVSKAPSFQQFKYYDVKTLAGTAFYRIKVIYNNNLVAYSSIEKIITSNEQPDIISIYPNPVKNVLTVDYKSKIGQEIMINIMQTDGKTITLKKAFVNIGYNKIPLETSSIGKGLYLVKISSHDGNAVVKKLYK